MNAVTGKRRKKKDVTHLDVTLEHVGGPKDGEQIVDIPLTMDTPLSLCDNYEKTFLEIHRTETGIKVRIYMMPPLVRPGGR